MEEQKTIGDRLKYFRRVKNLTQEEVAEELGNVTRATVAHYENGRNEVPVSMLPKIAKVLGIGITDLFGESAETNSIKAVKEELMDVFRQLSALTKENAELKNENRQLKSRLEKVA